MCETLRNTRSRGRSVVPEIRFRWRSAIRRRRSLVVLIFISLSFQLPATSFQHYLNQLSAGSWKPEAGSQMSLRPRLARLLLQYFAGVADTLLLVRVGLSQAADVGGDLADGLTIDPGHRDVRL